MAQIASSDGVDNLPTGPALKGLFRGNHKYLHEGKENNALK